jgi:hypothetical protein
VYCYASVQELVPRLYMELAILRCYHFLQKGPPVKQLRRLVGMCRGIGDPLVASYLRGGAVHADSPWPTPETRLVRTWFQPLSLSSEKPVSKFAFQIELAPLHRAYLAHKGLSLCPPGEKDYLIQQLSDFMPQYGLLLHPVGWCRLKYFDPCLEKRLVSKLLPLNISYPGFKTCISNATCATATRRR